MTAKEINKSLMLQTTRNKRVLFKINLHGCPWALPVHLAVDTIKIANFIGV